MIIRDIRFEKPLNRSPITLLIDDPTPGINPLYYFAEQVPSNAVDYHYVSKNGDWFFQADKEFRFPIAKSIDRNFIHEFASWVRSTNIKGKISIIPFPAGLGRVDRSIKGFPRDQIKEFLMTIRDEIMGKFDISSELLTHTKALDLKRMKLKGGISEHDWSQKQTTKTLTPYIGFSLEILKRAGINASGVTSPCNFGVQVENQYVESILEASKAVMKSGLAWYFLHVDAESLNVPHRLMHLSTENQETVVSIVASMNDALWTSMVTDDKKDEWIRKSLEPIISEDGITGRIIDLVSNGSYVTIVTHWQSLYSNGSRFGFDGLKEMIKRINLNLNTKILWMNCSEITAYLACSSSALIRTLAEDGAMKIEITSPFQAKDLTLSFQCDRSPESIEIDGLKLERVDSAEKLRSNSFIVLPPTESGSNVFVCLEGLKSTTKGKREDYYTSFSIR